MESSYDEAVAKAAGERVQIIVDRYKASVEHRREAEWAAALTEHHAAVEIARQEERSLAESNMMLRMAEWSQQFEAAMAQLRAQHESHAAEVA